MEQTNESPHAQTSEDAPEIGADPALRDASRILARAEADESAADTARELHRAQPIAPLEPDARVAAELDAGEQVFAVRRHAVLERRRNAFEPDAPTLVAGDLYLTSRRLIILGSRSTWFGLDEILEILTSGERLLIVMRYGEGAVLNVAQPRLLRVEIAAARAAARG